MNDNTQTDNTEVGNVGVHTEPLTQGRMWDTGIGQEREWMAIGGGGIGRIGERFASRVPAKGDVESGGTLVWGDIWESLAWGEEGDRPFGIGRWGEECIG